jgi:hypothetical protein
MTQLISYSQASGGTVVIFGLRNPTRGNKTLSCATSGPAQQYLHVSSYNNVNQTSDGAAFPYNHGAGGTGNTVSNPVTSATGDMVVDAGVDSGYNFSAPTGTILFNDIGGATRDAAASYNPGSATVTVGWTLANVLAVWADAAVDVAHQ